MKFLSCAPGLEHETILTTRYAAGLRISAAVLEAPTNIDSRHRVIRDEQGKGSIDRYVMLSAKLLEVLRHWWVAAKPKP